MLLSSSGKNPTLLILPNIWKWNSKTHQTATSNVWKLSATGGSSIKLSNADGNTQMESPSWWSQHRSEQHPREFNLWPTSQYWLTWSTEMLHLTKFIFYAFLPEQNKSENRLEKHFAFLMKKSSQVLDRISPLNATWVQASQGDISNIFSLIMTFGKTLLIQ